MKPLICLATRWYKAVRSSPERPATDDSLPGLRSRARRLRFVTGLSPWPANNVFVTTLFRASVVELLRQMAETSHHREIKYCLAFAASFTKSYLLVILLLKNSQTTEISNSLLVVAITTLFALSACSGGSGSSRGSESVTSSGAMSAPLPTSSAAEIQAPPVVTPATRTVAVTVTSVSSPRTFMVPLATPNWHNS